MRRLLLLSLLLTIPAATYTGSRVNLAVQPEVTVTLSEVENEVESGEVKRYKTPPHLRSTGGDACGPLPTTGVVTLYCQFGQIAVGTLEDDNAVTAVAEPGLPALTLFNTD